MNVAILCSRLRRKYEGVLGLPAVAGCIGMPPSKNAVYLRLPCCQRQSFSIDGSRAWVNVQGTQRGTPEKGDGHGTEAETAAAVTWIGLALEADGLLVLHAARHEETASGQNMGTMVNLFGNQVHLRIAAARSQPRRGFAITAVPFQSWSAGVVLLGRSVPIAAASPGETQHSRVHAARRW